MQGREDQGHAEVGSRVRDAKWWLGQRSLRFGMPSRGSTRGIAGNGRRKRMTCHTVVILAQELLHQSM